MADDLIEIPLFPLSLVLFPGMVQPLHIFEPRYREMTRYCLDTNVAFGIVLALPSSALPHAQPARVGALARIADYQRLPDGRYNLITVGAQRFEIVSIHDDKPYLSATARLLAEDLGEGDLASLTQQAHSLLEDYLSLVLSVIEGGEKAISVPQDTLELSYFIAVCLPVDDCVKQTLLEIPSASERLARECDLLRAEISEISAQLLHGSRPDDDDDLAPADRNLLN